MGAEEVPSGPFSSDAVDNADLSDTALVFAIRNALTSAQSVSLAQMLLLHICIYICFCVFFNLKVFSFVKSRGIPISMLCLFK